MVILLRVALEVFVAILLRVALEVFVVILRVA